MTVGYVPVSSRTPHPTSCGSSCASMEPFLFCCCGSLSHQETQHFSRTQLQYHTLRWWGSEKTIMQKVSRNPFTRPSFNRTIEYKKADYILPVTQCEKKLALSNTQDERKLVFLKKLVISLWNNRTS